MARRKSESGYGWLRVGFGSKSEFVIHEEKNHRVRLVIGDNETYIVRCSKNGCGFSIKNVETLDQAQKIASAHLAQTFLQR